MLYLRERESERERISYQDWCMTNYLNAASLVKVRAVEDAFFVVGYLIVVVVAEGSNQGGGNLLVPTK